MSSDANKDLIRRYIEAVDNNQSSDAGEIVGIPATGNDVETAGIVIHRIADGKIVEYWSVVDMARVLQQVGVLP